ncbi:hypothetical protein EJ04DRAFT_567287 [Polyplosphaeria fusca]|uniref:Uncharacterized protein n=1 Tax=Polyplosphaeria fusca TaxID=682080 RepID=A0A9P4UWC5_9PLEO|nr:hypothetical protein EJ04DRAFT_567287 [Polyplosphaeria fusca]
MVASILSAVITIVYIVVGWYKNWIRGFPHNSVDDEMTAVFRQPARGPNRHVPVSTKAQKNFETTILAFGDQQLVMSLALLISMHIKGDITVYTFQVASAMAWFLSTTHLATLMALKEHFREKTLARYCRIAFMISNTALLLAGQIQSNGMLGFTSWTAVRCIKADQFTYDVMDLFYALTFAERTWFFEYVALLCNLEPAGGSEKWPTSLQRYNERIARCNGEFGVYLYASAHFCVWFEAMVGSLFWEILWLALPLAYGLTGIAVGWVNCSQPPGSSDTCWSKVLEMGLGQMIPLITLLLPLFSFLESFAEAHAPDNAEALETVETVNRLVDNQPTEDSMNRTEAEFVTASQSNHPCLTVTNSVEKQSIIQPGMYPGIMFDRGTVFVLERLRGIG